MLEVRLQSPDELALLAPLLPLAEEYAPNDRLQEKMGKLNMVGIDGGTGAGKTTAIGLLLKYSAALGLPDIHKVDTFRTRPPRQEELDAIVAGEGRQFGTFVDARHPASYGRLVGDLLLGRLFQATPVGANIYGTRGDAVKVPTARRPSLINLTEYTGKEYERIAESGLVPGLRTVICVVPSNPADLEEKLLIRGGGELPKDMAVRIKENLQSTDIALHGTAYPTVFVQNPYSPMDGGSLEYDPHSNEIPPAFVALAAILHGSYSASHMSASRDAAEEYFACLQRLAAGSGQPAKRQLIAR